MCKGRKGLHSWALGPWLEVRAQWGSVCRRTRLVIVTVPPWEHTWIYDYGSNPGLSRASLNFLPHTNWEPLFTWEQAGGSAGNQFKGLVIKAGGPVVQGSHCVPQVSPHTWLFLRSYGPNDNLNSKVKPTISLASVQKEKHFNSLLDGEIIQIKTKNPNSWKIITSFLK